MNRTFRQPTSNANAIRNLACEAADMVATAVIDAFAEGRWSPAAPNAREFHALAHQVIGSLQGLGPVGAVEAADAMVAWIAEAAHILVTHARFAHARGQARIEGTALDSNRIEDMLLPAYSLLITVK